MSTCINKNHPDVIRIAEELNTLPAVAAAKIGVWQENNNILDRFPSTEELSQPSQVNYQKNQTVSTEGQIASEKTIRDLAARMADRIGIPVRIESDRTKQYKGKIENNVAVINLAYATLDTPIHEILGHPIVRALKTRGITDTNIEYKTTSAGTRVRYKNKNGLWVNTSYYKTKEEAEEFVKTLNQGLNNQLYQNLLKELEYGRGKEVLDRVKRDYTEKPRISIQYKNQVQYEGITINGVETSSFNNLTFKFNGKEYYITRNGSFMEITPEGTIDVENITSELKEKAQTVFETAQDIVQNGLPQGNYTLEEQQEEAIVELLGLMTAEKLDNVKDGKLISLLKRLLKEMKAFMRQLFNQKEVEIDKLPDNMTINDIADLLAYSNSKLILPGYEVEYTTPDNMKFKTYQEASNHISELAKSVEEIDLDTVKINLEQNITDVSQIKEKSFLTQEGIRYIRQNGKWYYSFNLNKPLDDETIIIAYNSKDLTYDVEEDTGKTFGIDKRTNINSFIEKNKEYEQSKEIIEEWKKVNNIQYNPEEVYSRGQGFYSAFAAYSDLDLDTLMANILNHIEDNEKAGGKFALSAFTKPIDKTIRHIEKSGLNFKIYPKPEHIMWAANTDVFSGSVWDASEKVNKDKKSELLGVSYTKYPSLNNVNAVQPNLASIIDNLAHHHNELGIQLTGNNFRLEINKEVLSEIDGKEYYKIKAWVDKINSILDQKYGKLVKPEINFGNKEIIRVELSDPYETKLSDKTFKTIQEAEEWIKKESKEQDDYYESIDEDPIYKWEYKIIKQKQGIQPTQTKDNLKESIDSIKSKIIPSNLHGLTEQDITTLIFTSNIDPNINASVNKMGNIKFFKIKENFGWGLDEYIDITPSEEIKQELEQLIKTQQDLQKQYKKEYTEQAVINTKIAKLKEVAKKYPRSLIRSEVVLSNNAARYNKELGFEEDDLPFQKVPSEEIIQNELQNFKDYFKIRTLDRVYEPNMFKGWKLRVEAINKRLGFEALQAVNYTPQGGKGRMRVKIKTEQPTTETRKITAVAYSNWFRMLPAEQKRSENALREQDGLPPLKVERQKLSPLQSETTEAADKKIAVLQKVFDVEVEYDSNLTDSEGNPVAGAVIPGVRPKIVLNPNRLAEDTVIHEFAHIFIDALGGLKNARVAAAVNKLKETELWAEVKEMYPELNENDLALEVLATAMGRRGSEIFEEETNATWWDNFVRWVTQRLAAWFKKDTDALEQITRDLFSKDNINLNLLSSGITQYSKTAQEAYARQKAIDKEKHSLQKLNDNVLSKLRTKHQIIRNSPSQAEGYEGYEKKLKETIKEIETISKTSPLLGLHKFVEYASTQLKSVESTVDKIINNEEFNEFIISKIDLFTGIFDDIDDYSKAVADNKLELENLGVPVENLEATLKDLSYNRDRSKALLKDARKRIAARLLAQQSTYAQDLARQRYQVEANKAGLKGVDKERYIHEQLIKNKDSFYKENVDFYYNMMDTTLTDITGLEAWVLDAYNINSHTIQIVQSLISNADLQTRKSVLDDKADIAAATEEFTNSGMYTPSKKFDKLIQKASNGIYYLRSKYKSDFNIELRKLKQAVSDALDTDGKDSDKHKEASDNLIKWLQENTITKGSRPSLSGGGLVPNIVPTDKWLDPEYATLNAKELKYLEFVKNKLLEQDRKVPSHKKLQQWPGSSINNPIIQLPGIEAKTSEVLLEQGVFSYIKESAKRLVKKSASDEEVFGSLNNEVQKDKGLKSVFTYESGEQKKDIPIFYRTQPEKQSLDLPTLLLLNSHTTNNYNNKFKILTQVNLLVRATAEKEIGKSEGTGLRKLLVSSTTNEPVTMSGKESKEYKVLQSIVEDNIFGVNTIDLHSTFLGADVNTILKNLGKWTSDSMLILNYLSAGANVLQGKVMNALEARSGGTLKVNNLRNGESMFWADSQGWLGDVGSRAPKSKTSLLMDFFNVKGDYSALSTHFFKNSKAASLLSWDRAHFLNGMGEFYTAATLMYSTLDKIKVMNRNREYIDVNGKVVKTEAEAASLSDVYEVKNGKLQIMSKHQTGKNAVTYTSLDYENVYNPAVVSNYIKKIYSDLHGQYDGALQSMAQRTAIGKLAFMLRKWMLPGLLRRWRGISTATQTEVNPQDRFYSHALKQEMEGNYTTAIRFITKMKKSMKELKFDAAYRLNWDELNDFEKANIRRTALEMGIMVSTLAASVILLNLAKDMDDDDEAAKTALMLTTFWTRRLYSEMSFYVNPGEMTRILRSPAATVSLIESSIRLTTQIQRDILTYDFEESSWHMFELERYERGPRKGEPKIIKKVEQVLPVFKNIRRDVEEATDYLWNTF